LINGLHDIFLSRHNIAAILGSAYRFMSIYMHLVISNWHHLQFSTSEQKNTLRMVEKKSWILVLLRWVQNNYLNFLTWPGMLGVWKAQMKL